MASINLTASSGHRDRGFSLSRDLDQGLLLGSGPLSRSA